MVRLSKRFALRLSSWLKTERGCGDCATRCASIVCRFAFDGDEGTVQALLSARELCDATVMEVASR